MTKSHNPYKKTHFTPYFLQFIIYNKSLPTLPIQQNQVSGSFLPKHLWSLSFPLTDSHDLQLVWITVTHNALAVNFNTFKHSQCSTPTMIIKLAKMVFVSLNFSLNICLSSSFSEAVFVDARGSHCQSIVTQSLKVFLEVLNLDPEMYISHSFRPLILLLQVIWVAIAVVGRWKSNAFKKYIKPTSIKAS